MTEKYNDEIFNGFKTFFPSIAKDTVEWSSKGKYIIRVILTDGSTVEYNHMLNTIRVIRDYSGTENDWKREFSENLSNIMTEKCVDQALLSDRSGISQGSISNYLRGKSIPTGYTIDRLARALDCEVQELMIFE